MPAMLVLLGIGVTAAIASEPELLDELGRVSFRLPELALTKRGFSATTSIDVDLFALGRRMPRGTGSCSATTVGTWTRFRD